ncbi:MAG: hypothetical protein U0667_08290 [Chloroflexota bacterium]
MVTVAWPTEAATPGAADVCPALGTRETAVGFFAERAFPAGTETARDDGGWRWVSVAGPMTATVEGTALVDRVALDGVFPVTGSIGPEQRWAVADLDNAMGWAGDLLDAFAYSVDPGASHPHGLSDADAPIWPGSGTADAPDRDAEMSIQAQADGLHVHAAVTAKTHPRGGCSPSPAP